MYFYTFVTEEYDVLLSSLFHHYDILNNHAVSFGYQWENQVKYLKEVEIMPFRYGRKYYMNHRIDSNSLMVYDESYEEQIYNSSVRYSYAYIMGCNKITLIIGCAGKLFYYNHRIIPHHSGEFFRSVTTTGLVLEFLPALQYDLSENISIRFDAPLSMMDIDFRRVKDDNPKLQKDHHISDQIGAYLLSRTFQFRIGMSCKIRNSLK